MTWPSCNLKFCALLKVEASALQNNLWGTAKIVSETELGCTMNSSQGQAAHYTFLNETYSIFIKFWTKLKNKNQWPSQMPSFYT